MARLATAESVFVFAELVPVGAAMSLATDDERGSCQGRSWSLRRKNIKKCTT